MNQFWLISKNALEEIWDVSQIYPEINERDAIFKIRDHIRQNYNKLKGA